jgi:hypothetical protein
MMPDPKPEKVGGGGAPGGWRKPPDQTGNFRKGLDKKVNRRCICCKREGPDVPQKAGTNPTMLGLHMGGHLEPDKRKAEKGDLRFAPWEKRGVDWITKPNRTTLNVTWPAGMGPMCCILPFRQRARPRRHVV